MDLDTVARLVTERLSGRASADVGIEIGIVGAGWLDVRVHSQNPVTWYHSGVRLHPDGRVVLPPSDDGCTPPGTPTVPLGTATTVSQAVDLVVAEVETAIARTDRRIAAQLVGDLPSQQPPVATADLAVACELWQSGQDVGSSFLRGAARVLTGVPHYFRADFISDQEQAARRSPKALHAGVALLRGVNSAPRRDADGWNAATGLPLRGFAGRGLKSKPQDDQILEQLRRGEITMPLWGVSLDPAVAHGFGTRFLLEIVGEFPAVPAWVASGVTDDEQELITGGRYRVVSQTEDGGTTHVRLQWIGAAGDRVGSDDVLIEVLSALDEVRTSELTRSPDGAETLTVRLPGDGNGAEVTRAPGAAETLMVRLPGDGNWAEVTRAPGAAEVVVHRYYTPEDDPQARDDSVWTQQRQMLAASRRTTVPARADDVLDTVLTPRT